MIGFLLSTAIFLDFLLSDPILMPKSLSSEVSDLSPAQRYSTENLSVYLMQYKLCMHTKMIHKYTTEDCQATAPNHSATMAGFYSVIAQSQIQLLFW